MKILYVITKSNFGGAQRYVYELATAMKENDYDVTVLAGGNGLLSEKLNEQGINFRTIKNFQRDINPLRELLAFVELWKCVREIRPDIIHTNSSKAGFLGALVGRLAGANKIIFTAHGWPFLEERPRWWKILTWTGSYLTALLAHQVVLVSKNDLNHTQMPGVNKKCLVIHTGVPQITFKDRDEARRQLFDTETIESHKFDYWLVTNAELHPNKNQQAVIDVVSDYNQSNRQKIFYCLMSNGEQLAELKEYVDEKGLNEYVYFLGYIDNGRSYMQAFDIFILPSKKEGLPYALLEAGAAGIPAIASRVGGIPEVITDHKDGLLINPLDNETISQALATLIAEPDLRSRYATSLQKKVNSDYSLEKMINSTIELYSNQ